MLKRILFLVCLNLFLSFHTDAVINTFIDNIGYQLDTSAKTATLCSFKKDISKAVIKRFVENDGVFYQVKTVNPSSSFSNGTLTIDELEIEDSVNIKWVYSSSSFSINKLIIGRGVRLRQASGSIASPWRGIKEIYCKDDIPVPCTIHDQTNSNAGVGKLYLFPFFDEELKVYVPKGAERTYMYSFGWGNVDQIIGLDELGHVASSSTTYDSYFNFNQNSAIINANTDELVSLKFDNKIDIKGIEFDLVLPSDVELVGDMPIQKCERTDECNFLLTNNENGSYHIMLISPSVLTYGKGEIAKLMLKTTKSGTFSILLKNAVVTTTSNTLFNLDESELQFVAEHLKGDYNDDGLITISDVTTLIDYLLFH